MANTNLKDALLNGVETPEVETPAQSPRGRGRAQAPEAAPAVEATEPTVAPEETTKVEAPKTVHIKPNTEKVFYAIGLKDYSTSIAGRPVHVQAGKPWQGTKYQYDVLKRAKLIQ